jgi:hypothetical protein
VSVPIFRGAVLATVTGRVYGFEVTWLSECDHDLYQFNVRRGVTVLWSHYALSPEAVVSLPDDGAVGTDHDPLHLVCAYGPERADDNPTVSVKVLRPIGVEVIS